MHWNPKTGAPHLASGPPLAIPGFARLNAQNVQAACLSFIHANRGLFKLHTGQLRLASAVRAAGRWRVVFQQVKDGLPVLGGRAALDFTSDDRLVRFKSDVWPDVNISTEPRVDVRAALGAVARETPNASASDHVGKPELCIVPVRAPAGPRYLLCYRTAVLQREANSKWEYLVSAETGRVIAKWDALQYGDVTGRVMLEYKPEFAADSTHLDSASHEWVTAKGREVAFAEWSLDTNPGWAASGQWAFGAPMGLGGQYYGYPDPTSGHTGTNVYGVNLLGDYSTMLGSAGYLTLGPINCTGLQHVRLRFWRWLNTDSYPFVDTRVEVSADNMTWTTVWTNGEREITDNRWVEVAYDISALADNCATLYVRWGYAVLLAHAWPYSGWNIDDVSLTAIYGGLNTVATDQAGTYSVVPPEDPCTVQSELRGPYCDINCESAGADAQFRADGVRPGANVSWTWDSSRYSLIDEPTVFRHTNFIHDYYKAIDGAFSGLDYPMPVRVGVPNYCNAYWDGQGMTFGGGDGIHCASFGLFSEIVYHEYTHGVTDRIYQGIYFPYAMEAGAMNEGWSDYFGCALSLSQSPKVGDGGALIGYPNGFRTLANAYRRETDWGNEVHWDGQMFSGSLWEARQAVGSNVIDPLVHFARYRHATSFADYALALLMEDDAEYGDGLISNGTPHAEAIYAGFGNHGIGGLRYVAPSVVILDRSGNGNGKLEPGETVGVSLTLKNDWSDATNIRAELATADPYVSVTKTSAAFPDAAHGTLVTNADDPFSLTVSAGCPDTHTISFILTVTADGPYKYRTTCLFTYAVAVQQIAYDDGQRDAFIGYGRSGGALAVRMTPDAYPCYVTKIRLCPSQSVATTVKLWADDGPHGLPGQELASVPVTPSTTEQWFDVDVSHLKLAITGGSFYVGWVEGSSTYFNGFDEDPPYYDRSYVYLPDYGEWFAISDFGYLGNVMVRVVTLAAPTNIIHVSGRGNDENDGLTWEKAKRTVQAGIAAAPSEYEVWVAAGEYHEHIEMKSQVSVYGGFAGTEMFRDQRKWTSNLTVLDGNGAGSVVSCFEGVFDVVLDGFTVRNGGFGVFCDSSSPIISNNVIADNFGDGIRSLGGSPEIRANLLRTNSGSGVCVVGGSPVITENLSIGNLATGIECRDSAARIERNTASRNQAGGVRCEGGSASVVNNVLWRNTQYGVYCAAAGSSIVNNTISDTVAGPGIYCLAQGLSLVNNIVAFCAIGIKADGAVPMLTHNDVYGNTPRYVGLPPGPTDIAADPRFGNRAEGDLHLLAGSPCIDAGTNVGAPSSDRDGRMRPWDGDGNGVSTCDIGAYEAGALYGLCLVKWDAPGPTHDGKTWTTAYRTVTEGLQMAREGTEIWVAAGVYNERISLKTGVALYGGFAGTEVSRVERDFAMNRTVLDGGSEGRVVTANSGTNDSRIDGFTIQNGYGEYGAGIFCRGSSPTIANNVIRWNRASCGGGICAVEQSSPLIVNNVMVGNAAEKGASIYCDHGGAPSVTNNTIVENGGKDGAGIWCGSVAPVIANNIIAFNQSGVASVAAPAAFRNNCVYGNTAYNYTWTSDPTGSDGNISVDPKLASSTYGNVHIQPDSPCRDAGTDSVADAVWLDMDAQPRIQGAHIDIGADESDGSGWQPGPYVTIHVRPDGSDQNDGLTWGTAKRTVQAGINAARDVGGDIWVKAGAYSERIELYPFTYLFGGFNGDESQINRRAPLPRRVSDPRQTVLDGGMAGPVVVARLGNTATGIDGFTITQGAFAGSGVFIQYASPKISNNTIISNGIVNDPYQSQGGGIGSYDASPTITCNIIADNDAYGGAGIYCLRGSPIITNCLISGNNAASYGGGILFDGAAATLTNNTIVDNAAKIAGGGVACGLAAPWLYNNIVAFNSHGIFNEGGSPALYYNDVALNLVSEYQGTVPGVGDLSADPAFVDRAGGDYHLSAVSPCVNRGFNAARALPTTDVDHQPRKCMETVDIGADELWPAASALSDCKRQPEGTYVAMKGLVVTAKVDSNSFYVEAEDRSAGIRVRKIRHSATAGMKVDLIGKMITSTDGERYLDAPTVTRTGTGVVAPVWMQNQALGGGDWFYDPGPPIRGQKGVKDGWGVNNIGLLVRTVGRVRRIDNTSFYLEDGSAASVVVTLLSGVSAPPDGAYVSVTGISSCRRVGGDLYRLIRAREIAVIQ